MRPTLIGLAAALCWTGAFGAALAGGDAKAEMAVPARRLLSRISNRHRNATAGFAQLGLRQATGQCGPQYGRCPDEQCCSEYGFCGDSIDHCHPLFDCQEDYGVCGWPRPRPTPTTSSTSTSSTPTTSSTTTPGTPSTSTTTTSTIPSPTGDLEVTTDGRCGNNTICIGNPNFGPCCSQFFWCGSSIEYCGPGCQSQFGACLGVPGQPGQPPTNGTTTTSGDTAYDFAHHYDPSYVQHDHYQRSAHHHRRDSSRHDPSTDGRCGNGVTCLGSNYGRCCSQFGWCGDGDQYCPYIVGCQPEFGYCDPRP